MIYFTLDRTSNTLFTLHDTLYLTHLTGLLTPYMTHFTLHRTSNTLLTLHDTLDLTHLTGDGPEVPDVGVEVVAYPLPEKSRVQDEEVHHGQHDEVDGGVGPPHALARQDGDGHRISEATHHQQDGWIHAPHLQRRLSEVLSKNSFRVRGSGGTQCRHFKACPSCLPPAQMLN